MANNEIKRCKKCYEKLHYSRCEQHAGFCRRCAEEEKKNVKICPICNQEYNRSLFGDRKYLKDMCPECFQKQRKEKARIKYEARTAKQKEKDRLKVLKCQRARRARYKETGLCQDCGSQPPSPGKTQCPKCLKRQRDNHNAKKVAWVESKGGKCFRCGQTFPPEAFDFHHLAPSEKEYNPAALLNMRDQKTVEEELSKCVLLCANCHRIEHKGERTEQNAK